MLEIKVNIEAQDLSQAITHLATAIQGETVAVPVGELSGERVPQEAPQTAIPVQPEVSQATASAQPDAPQVAEPNMNVPQPPVIDLNTISRAGAALVDQGKMAEVLGVLRDKYGIQAVTQLAPAQYESFANDLRALGADI